MVASDGLVSSLVDDFGQSIAVHAKSPLVVACPDGSTETVAKGAFVRELRNVIDDTCS